MDEYEKKLMRILEAMDEAWPRDEQEARAELRSAGLEPALVRARMRALAEEAMGGSRQEDCVPPQEYEGPLPLPWVRQIEGAWVCDPTVAGQSREDHSWFKLDYGMGGIPCSVKLLVFLRSESDGSRALHIEWEANIFCRQGWRLRLFRFEKNQPLFSRNLGPGFRGSVALGSADLGLDPAMVPLKFSFEPDTSPSSDQKGQ